MFFISFVSTFTKLVDLCMEMLVIGEKLFVFVKNSIVAVRKCVREHIDFTNAT